MPKFQGENFYKNKAIVDEIKKLADQKKCSINQLALAWVAAQGFIAIPGTTKSHRLETNFASRDIELTDDEKKAMRKLIDAAKPHGNRYNEGKFLLCCQGYILIVFAASQAMVGH